MAKQTKTVHNSILFDRFIFGACLKWYSTALCMVQRSTNFRNTWSC